MANPQTADPSDARFCSGVAPCEALHQLLLHGIDVLPAPTTSPHRRGREPAPAPVQAALFAPPGSQGGCHASPRAGSRPGGWSSDHSDPVVFLIADLLVHGANPMHRPSPALSPASMPSGPLLPSLGQRPRSRLAIGDAGPTDALQGPGRAWLARRPLGGFGDPDIDEEGSEVPVCLRFPGDRVSETVFLWEGGKVVSIRVL